MPSDPPLLPLQGQPVPLNRASGPLKANAARFLVNDGVVQAESRETRYRQVAAETSGKWEGPIDTQEFLDKYLPVTSSTPTKPAFDPGKFLLASQTENGAIRKEEDMYNPLESALNDFCPHLHIAITGNLADSSWPNYMGEVKIDLSFYQQGATTRPADLDALETFAQVKFHQRSTGFNDAAPAFEHDTEDSTQTRGQLATYAGAMMSAQFRTHVFCMEITDNYARLIRFDREGAVVTKQFRYHQDQYLAEFMWRFNHASPEARGRDPSVILPEAADATHVNNLRLKLKLKPERRVWKFQIHNELTNQLVVLFGTAVKENQLWATPFGRCSRGYLAMTLDGRLVYLKDTWRIDLPAMTKEGDIYAHLHANDIPNIPHVSAHGDVVGIWQETGTRLSKGIDKPNCPLRHYRLVLQEVCRRLVSFKTTWELLNAIKDAMKAHEVAYEKAKILHRDVSTGNIMISPDGKRGFLIDWEFSKPVTENEMPHQVERVGTWQFMSCRLVDGHNIGRHLRSDDLESFFHVLSWVIIRYGHWGATPEDGVRHLRYSFDYIDRYRSEPKSKSKHQPQTVPSGGKLKLNGLKARFMGTVLKIKNSCLRSLVADFEDLVCVSYEPSPTQAEIDEFDDLSSLANHNESRLQHQPVLKYRKRLRNLEDWSWIYGRFCEALQDVSIQMEPRNNMLPKQLDAIQLTSIRETTPRANNKCDRDVDDDLLASGHKSQRCKTEDSS
ncbi:hypothetical protein VNI00_014151 [Paramarasmius palmivorus]|uniref:Fungal-type protein kinase domain-containing protein n=1 Tax=Paramarasmius palmivorus TaxID=297713 RepID=A0AAW0BUH1_9AGAR